MSARCSFVFAILAGLSLAACGPSSTSSAPTFKLDPTKTTLTDGAPHAVYAAGDKLFAVLDASADATGDPAVVSVGEGLEAKIYEIAKLPKAEEVTLVGPDGSCQTSGSRVVVVDATQSGGSIGSLVGVELSKCGDVGAPVLAFGGVHELAWETLHHEAGVDSGDLLPFLDTVDGTDMARPLTYRTVAGYNSAAGASFITAFVSEMPETATFYQDMCSKDTGPAGWAIVSGEIVAHFPRPVVAGAIKTKDSVYLAVTEDYGEMISVYDVTSPNKKPVVEAVMPFPYTTVSCDGASAGPSLVGGAAAGPFASVDEYCAKEAGSCTPGGAKGTTSVSGPSAPFSAVELFAADKDGLSFINIAITTDKGVYIVEELAVSSEPGSESIWIDADRLEVKDILSPDGPELILEYTANERWEEPDPATDEDSFQHQRVHEMVLCGVGGDGTPSCLRVPTGWSIESISKASGSQISMRETRADVKFTDGNLNLQVDTARLSNDVARRIENFVGANRVTF